MLVLQKQFVVGMVPKRLAQNAECAVVRVLCSYFCSSTSSCSCSCFSLLFLMFGLFFRLVLHGHFKAELFAANKLGATQKAHKHMRWLTSLLPLHVGWCAHPKSRHSRSSSPVCARWHKNYNAPPALPARPYFPRFFLPKRRAKTLSFILKDSVRKCLSDQFRLLQSHPGAT